MMSTPTWLELAQGPLFYFALAILFLGLARLILLSIWGIAAALHRAGDRHIPYSQVLKETIIWLVPVTRLHRSRPLHSYASFIFHVGLILAGLFLQNHLDILRANLGFAWPAISRPILDVLTLATIITGAFILLYRLYARSARAMSRVMDYVLLLLILSIFISGYVAGRPWNLIPYNSLMLFHTICGLALLMLIPFSKIAHCVLFPLVRLSSEIAWHFPPQGGSNVIKTLYGPEGRKI
jgi:nitrate reductase gamma subunit